MHTLPRTKEHDREALTTCYLQTEMRPKSRRKEAESEAETKANKVRSEAIRASVGRGLQPKSGMFEKVTCKLQEPDINHRTCQNNVGIMSNQTAARQIGVESMPNRPEYRLQPPRAAGNHPKSTKSRNQTAPKTQHSSLDRR